MTIERIFCDDCRTPNLETFMITDAVWLSVATKKAHLCLSCFEKRIGRRVTLHDLKPCMVTNSMFVGAYIAKATPNLPPDAVLLDPTSHTTERRFTYPIPPLVTVEDLQ